MPRLKTVVIGVVGTVLDAGHGRSAGIAGDRA
jgi:hypothetical protein